MWGFTTFFLKFKPNFLVKRMFLFYAAFAMAILDKETKIYEVMKNFFTL